MSNAKSSAKQRAAKLRTKPAAAKLLCAPLVARSAKSRRVMGLNPK